MPNRTLTIFAITLLLLPACKLKKDPSALSENSADTAKKVQEKTIEFKDKRSVAIYKAKKLYEDQKKLDVDFSKSQCLSNDLFEDWVADIAHNPRIEEDNKPENQCSAYLNKKAKHFVELDQNGNVIRAM